MVCRIKHAQPGAGCEPQFAEILPPSGCNKVNPTVCRPPWVQPLRITQQCRCESRLRDPLQSGRLIAERKRLALPVAVINIRMDVPRFILHLNLNKTHTSVKTMNSPGSRKRKKRGRNILLHHNPGLKISVVPLHRLEIHIPSQEKMNFRHHRSKLLFISDNNGTAGIIGAFHDIREFQKVRS